MVKQRESEGDIELENFLKPRDVSIDRLYEFGILKNDRNYFSTTDLFVHAVTKRGRQFLKEVKDCQLIFVRRAAAARFDDFLNQAKTSWAGKIDTQAD